MNSFPPKTLAIDFGTKRVGLALSVASLAEPLTILQYASGRTDLVVSAIVEILENEAVQQVVVGISEAEMAEKTKDFVDLLQHQTRVPIELVDETLSSKETQELLHESGQTGLSKSLDHFAAAHFLQQWLDEYSIKK